MRAFFFLGPFQIILPSLMNKTLIWGPHSLSLSPHFRSTFPFLTPQLSTTSIIATPPFNPMLPYCRRPTLGEGRSTTPGPTDTTEVEEHVLMPNVKAQQDLSRTCEGCRHLIVCLVSFLPPPAHLCTSTICSIIHSILSFCRLVVTMNQLNLALDTSPSSIRSTQACQI
jgi:hypothetical protein